ncbi:uncharacterized protein LOC100367896 [Saccoglossus kowalevskii]|uniref:phosphoethanolamine N-methyltransferase n=1 Tax=Saccoglossus kowalevskii TaxID=10224 RepID=A0ABM0GXR9_SACKO|nr:PREDICTED: phosphoethanolamine N-methyltransferase 1-like [Saccoglossus kowalevskii]
MAETNVSSQEETLKSVKLYYDVERIYNELKELGYSKTDPLKIEDLCKIDQYHYHGTEAVQEAIQLLNINADHKVLDVGSGLGGPARYLANITKCHVTAIEIQHQLDVTAKDLTKRCQLDHYVHHECGDILTADFGSNKYDIVASWLVYLHIADKKSLFKSCYKLLKPGGKLFAEDFWTQGTFTSDEKKLLDSVVYCPNLPDKESYKDSLSQAGFTDIQVLDMSDDWTEHCTTRLTDFQSKKERHTRVLGLETVAALELFYTVVADSFTSGKLKGGRILATKPLL